MRAPETVGQANQPFTATEATFTQKNTMFRANPKTFKSHPGCSSPNATCQYCIRACKTPSGSQLLCSIPPFSTLFLLILIYFTFTPTLLPLYLCFFFALLYSSLLFPILLCATLLFSALCCSILFLSTLTLFFSIRLYSSLFGSILFYSVLFCSVLTYSILFCSVLF